MLSAYSSLYEFGINIEFLFVEILISTASHGSKIGGPIPRIVSYYKPSGFLMVTARTTVCRWAPTLLIDLCTGYECVPYYMYLEYKPPWNRRLAEMEAWVTNPPTVGNKPWVSIRCLIPSSRHRSVTQAETWPPRCRKYHARLEMKWGT